MKCKPTTFFVILWAASLLAAVMYFSMTKIRPFDPTSRLANNMADLQFDQRLQTLLREQGISLQNAVIHFTDSGCICARIASLHIHSVKELAQSQQYHNTDIPVSQIPHLTHFIPSVPAVAVFNDQAQLSYLGPYSTGLFCSPNKGIVEQFIPSKTGLLGANIVHEAQGCYCAV